MVPPGFDHAHAAEPLGGLARALYPTDEEVREAWLDGSRSAEANGRQAQRTQEVRARAAAEVVRDFSDQARRADNPDDVARGWAIGSGPIEVDGAVAICHPRALFKSGVRPWNASGALTPR